MQHLVPPGGSNADLTFEKLIDRGFFICGDPDTVYDGIKSLYDEVGGFGTLLLITGKDWGTLEQRTRSMERFMAEVAPRLAKLDPDRVRLRPRRNRFGFGVGGTRGAHPPLEGEGRPRERSDAVGVG